MLYIRRSTEAGRPLLQEEALRVVSVSFSVSPWNDWQSVLMAILKGAESAGASTESYFFSTGVPATGQMHPGSANGSAEPDVNFLVSRLQAAECAIFGIAGAVDLNGSLFGRFANACLVSAQPRAQQSDGSAAPAQPTRRALVMVQPPSEMTDHDDPWSGGRFGVLEDLAAALAFAPAGRILSTGIFHPSVAQNPFIQEQAAQLGRRLATWVAIDGRKS
jgi:hypothetical protein